MRHIARRNMRISSFSLVAVLSCVSVILAIPIEGRTPVMGIDRRQPDETNLYVPLCHRAEILTCLNTFSKS